MSHVRYTVRAVERGPGGAVVFEQSFPESVFPDAYRRIERHYRKIKELWADCDVYITSSPEESQCPANRPSPPTRGGGNTSN